MDITYIHIIFIVMSWAGSGAITYGFLKAKILDFERRVTHLEDRHNDFVTRIEYDNRHEDMIRQLERIEGKIDQLFGTKVH